MLAFGAGMLYSRLENKKDNFFRIAIALSMSVFSFFIYIVLQDASVTEWKAVILYLAIKSVVLWLGMMIKKNKGNPQNILDYPSNPKTG